MEQQQGPCPSTPSPMTPALKATRLGSCFSWPDCCGCWPQPVGPPTASAAPPCASPRSTLRGAGGAPTRPQPAPHHTVSCCVRGAPEWGGGARTWALPGLAAVAVAQGRVRGVVVAGGGVRGAAAGRAWRRCGCAWLDDAGGGEEGGAALHGDPGVRHYLLHREAAGRQAQAGTGGQADKLTKGGLDQQNYPAVRLCTCDIHSGVPVSIMPAYRLAGSTVSSPRMKSTLSGARCRWSRMKNSSAHRQSSSLASKALGSCSSS